MADLVATIQTSLGAEDIIVRAVQFFTNEKWKPQTQSGRIATFQGRPPIPGGLIFLTIIAYCLFIIPGLIMQVVVLRKISSFQNLVVTVNQVKSASEVTITYPKHARKLVSRFQGLLPAVNAA